MVPATALSPPNGEGSGLAGEYRRVVDGQEKTVTRIDGTLDFVWDSTRGIISENRDQLTSLAGQAWSRVTNPDYLAECEAEGAVQRTHMLFAAPELSQMFTSRQRAEFVNEVLTRPAMLENVSWDQVCGVYMTNRVGALDEALEVVGKWARMHPNAEPEITADFFNVNRRQYRRFTVPVALQYRPHLDLMEGEYLELPEEGCSLPVAYVLSYAHLGEGRIDQWIGKLDARLEDESLSGDQRVNWLLARAQAEEIRESRASSYFRSYDRPLAGHGWIETACLVAETEPVRARAYKELVVRWAGAGELETATKLIETAQERLSGPASTKALAAWRQQVDRLAEQARRWRDESADRANQAYIKSLKDRRTKAIERGDEEAISRYKAMLERAKGDAGND